MVNEDPSTDPQDFAELEAELADVLAGEIPFESERAQDIVRRAQEGPDPLLDAETADELRALSQAFEFAGIEQELERGQSPGLQGVDPHQMLRRAIEATDGTGGEIHRGPGSRGAVKGVAAAAALLVVIGLSAWLLNRSGDRDPYGQLGVELGGVQAEGALLFEPDAEGGLRISVPRDAWDPEVQEGHLLLQVKAKDNDGAWTISIYDGALEPSGHYLKLDGEPELRARAWATVPGDAAESRWSSGWEVWPGP